MISMILIVIFALLVFLCFLRKYTKCKKNNMPHINNGKDIEIEHSGLSEFEFPLEENLINFEETETEKYTNG